MQSNSSKLFEIGPTATGCWLACCAALLAGCDLPGKPDPADRPRTPSEVRSFDALFATNCAGCHGAEGRLGPAPPLNDPLFLNIISPELMSQVIHNGRLGTPMPAFARAAGGALTDEQIGILAEGLRKHWKTEKKFAKPLPAYQLSDDSQPPASGDAKRGEAVFVRACAECHGENGTGKGGYVGAINDPDFLDIISNQALRRIIITGRADLGMPNYAEDDGRPADFQPLSSAEIDDLVALLASWRNTSKIAATAPHASSN